MLFFDGYKPGIYFNKDNFGVMHEKETVISLGDIKSMSCEETLDALNRMYNKEASKR